MTFSFIFRVSEGMWVVSRKVKLQSSFNSYQKRYILLHCKEEKLSNIRIFSPTKICFYHLIQNQLFEKQRLGYLSTTGLQ